MCNGTLFFAKIGKTKMLYVVARHVHDSMWFRCQVLPYGGYGYVIKSLVAILAEEGILSNWLLSRGGLEISRLLKKWKTLICFFPEPEKINEHFFTDIKKKNST